MRSSICSGDANVTVSMRPLPNSPSNLASTGAPPRRDHNCPLFAQLKPSCCIDGEASKFQVTSFVFIQVCRLTGQFSPIDHGISFAVNIDLPFYLTLCTSAFSIGYRGE